MAWANIRIDMPDLRRRRLRVAALFAATIIADMTALVLVDFAARLKIGFADDAENLRRWYDDVSARPSAAA